MRKQESQCPNGLGVSCSSAHQPSKCEGRYWKISIILDGTDAQVGEYLSIKADMYSD